MKYHISALAAVLLLCIVQFSHGATCAVTTVTSSTVSVTLTFDDHDQKSRPVDNCFVFSVTSSKAAVPAVSVTSGPGSARVLLSGYAGTAYRTWIGCTLPNGPLTGKTTATVIFDRPVYATQNPSSCTVSGYDCTIALQSSGTDRPKLAKTVSVPFTKGVRLEVISEGMYQISGSELRALNVPIDRISSREYRLFETTREVPVYITNPHHSHLKDNDQIVFYGRPLLTENGRPTQYSESNMYWLCWGTGRAGIRFAEVSGARRYDPTLYREGEELEVSAREFRDTLHIEIDSDIRWLGDVFAAENIDNPPQDQILDNWYWGFVGDREQTEFMFSVPSPSLDDTKSARLRIGMVGLSSVKDVNPDHEYTILLNGDSPSGTHAEQVARWDGQTPFEFVTDLFPVSQLNHGDNTLTFVHGPGRNDRSALNWVTVEYPRSFRALNDQILFTNNPEDVNGLFEFTLKGFSTNNLELWDIGQSRFFSGFDIVASAGGKQNTEDRFSLVFQDSLNTVTRFLAQSVSRRKRPVSMQVDSIMSDTRFSEPVDYVIVAAAPFVEDYQVLANHYRDRGIAATVVSVTDLYNKFSGGIRDPEAIHTFLAWLWDRFPSHPPQWLLLGGDTSHDLDKKRKELNSVPTHLSRAPGWGPCSDDGYFGTINGEDNLPDLCVGRFPVRTRSEVQQMISKTILYETNLPTGFWRDNVLMIGGAESDFSAFNDKVINEVVWPRISVLRMDANAGSPWFKDASVAGRTIADHINAGVYCINFNGHGGGNTWSDNDFFSYTDLSRLYNGRWGNAGRLPIVFSFTCLTGFFESVFYRSLGEEFVRMPSGGAIAFYGASAYTSKSGNFVMNRLMLDRAFSAPPSTVGQLVWLNEIESLVRYGRSYLPLIRQYNLLGDPALPWSLAADSLSVQLNKNAFTGTDTIAVNGTCSPVINGSARVRVGSGQTLWSDQIVTVQNSGFETLVPLKSAALTSQGWVRAFAWDDSSQVLGHKQFSKDMLLASNVSISPQRPSYGAPVSVSCRFDFPDPAQIQNALCLYETGTSDNPIEASSTQLLAYDAQTNMWTTTDPVEIESDGSPNDVFKVQFRVIAANASLESDLYVFPIRGLPDLDIIEDAIEPYWYNDSLRVSLTVLNAGSESAPGYTMVLRFADTGDTIAVTRSMRPLATGAIDHFEWTLPDTSGTFALDAICGSQSMRELKTVNNRVTGTYTVSHTTLATVRDTLASPGGGLAIWPPRKPAVPLDIFLFSRPCTDSQPLLTESSWIPLEGDNTAIFTLGVRPENNDSLVWQFRPDTTAPDAGSARVNAPVFDTLFDQWRYDVPAMETAGGRFRMLTASRGPYALARFSDLQEPQIRATVHGRELKFLDYAAKNKPFNLYLTDPSGVLPFSVTIYLNGNLIDTTRVSRLASGDGFCNVPLTAYPAKEHAIDSLTVEAVDFAGNLAKRTFAYLPGEDLSIKFLSCHPNPFAAAQGADGLTMHPPRFAFLLTDVADAVTLTVYTMAGRVVRSWRFIDMIGYQEVEWNGKTAYGHRIANGTYFVKLTAHNDREKIEKIIKIAKLEGY